MLGNLLVSPATSQSQTTVNAYFPPDYWYDYFNGSRIAVNNDAGENMTLDTPLDKINVHQRGMSIVVTQNAANNTHTQRANPTFQLQVAPCQKNLAFGELFWDDGESDSTYASQAYDHITFEYNGSQNGGQLTSKVVANNYSKSLALDAVTIFGITSQPKTLNINNNPSNSFSFQQDTNVLRVQNVSVALTSPITISFSY